LLLDTHSAVDIVFDGLQRTVHLRKGRSRWIPRRTHGLQRPFAVHTALGRLRALGTRFTVRQEDAVVHLAVTEGAVEVTLHGATVPRTVVPAGSRRS
jgi:transmembrane sensor